MYPAAARFQIQEIKQLNFDFVVDELHAASIIPNQIPLKRKWQENLKLGFVLSTYFGNQGGKSVSLNKDVFQVNFVASFGFKLSFLGKLEYMLTYPITNHTLLVRRRTGVN